MKSDYTVEKNPGFGPPGKARDMLPHSTRKTIQRGYILALILLIVGSSLQSTTFGQEGKQDETPLPLDQIPRLPMVGSSVDYKETLRAGTLAPDVVTIDSVQIRTAMLEDSVRQALGEEFSVSEDETYRSRDQQWSYVRRMAQQHDDSMHYYILAAVYYDRQLSGRFKIYDWRLGDLVLRAHLWRPSDTDRSRIWLIHAVMDTLADSHVSYLEGDHLALVRKGSTHVEWNVERNEIIISRDINGERRDE